MTRKLLPITYNAGAAVAARRFVKFGSSDKIVVQGAASTDALIGVSDPAGNVPSGERVDVIHVGLAEIDCAGTVNRGDLVMSNADGKAVVATAAAGVNVRTGGQALATGTNARILILVQPGMFQGAGLA